MSNCLLVFGDLCEKTATTIAGGDEVVGMEATRVGADQPSAHWRADTLASAYLTFDIGQPPADVDFAAVLYTNATKHRQFLKNQNVLTAADWTATRATAAAAGTSVIDPLGDTDAWKLTEDTTVTSTHDLTQTLTLPGGTFLLGNSIWLAPGGGATPRDHLRMALVSGSDSVIMDCDATNGVIDNSAVGGAFTNLTLGTPELDAASGFYRFSYTVQVGDITSLTVTYRLGNGSGYSYTGDGSSYILMAWPRIEIVESAAVTAVEGARDRASTASTWRIRSARTSANVTASPIYDSQRLPVPMAADLTTWPWIHSYKALGATYNLRFWRIDIDDLNNADTFLDVGRVYLGAAWQPTNNLEFGWTITYEDASPALGEGDGATYFTRWRRRRVVDLQFPILPVAEAYAYGAELIRRRGRSRSVLFVADPAATSLKQEQCVYGTLQELSPIEHPDVPGMVGLRFRIREML